MNGMESSMKSFRKFMRNIIESIRFEVNLNVRFEIGAR